MLNKIKILDCTLRDGGYVNNWQFSNEISKSIIKSLIKSGIEIIECGFINQKKGKENNTTLFKNINALNNHLADIQFDKSNHLMCAMINYGTYDFNDLPVYDPQKHAIEGIRLAFHKKDRFAVLNDAQILIDKGYKVFIQAMVTLSYSDLEILEFLNKVNKLNVYAMYIVDSFGNMKGSDFRRLHYLFENNLRSDIILGYHSHNNLQLAYSNAIDFIEIKNSNRNIIIDSSIKGMGRGAGNLNSELFADYLNQSISKKYNIIPLLNIIDNYLEAIYNENQWGYSIAHFLSASVGCHPNYSSYLLNKKRLPVVSIQKILNQISPEKLNNYDESYIEKLYFSYNSSDNIESNLPATFFDNQNILILASGPSINKFEEKIKKYINNNNSKVFIVNHQQKNYKADYYFFSNQKRYNKHAQNIPAEKLITTSNIKLLAKHKNSLHVNYQRLVSQTPNHNDNVSVLFLNLLMIHKTENTAIAGLDGYNINTTENYSYNEQDRLFDKKQMLQINEITKISLEYLKNKLQIHFITPSIFE